VRFGGLLETQFELGWFSRKVHTLMQVFLPRFFQQENPYQLI